MMFLPCIKKDLWKESLVWDCEKGSWYKEMDFMIKTFFVICCNGRLPNRKLCSKCRSDVWRLPLQSSFCFKDQFFQLEKKLNSFQHFPSLARLQVFLIFMKCLLKSNSQRFYLELKINLTEFNLLIEIRLEQTEHLHSEY